MIFAISAADYTKNNKATVRLSRQLFQEAGRLWPEASYRTDDYAVGSLVCEVAGRRDDHLEGDLPLPRGIDKAGQRVQRLRPLVNQGFAAELALDESARAVSQMYYCIAFQPVAVKIVAHARRFARSCRPAEQQIQSECSAPIPLNGQRQSESHPRISAHPAIHQ